MDEAFLLRARRLLGGTPARPRLDHAALIASAEARQALTPTARLAAMAPPSAMLDEAAAILVRGDAGWRSARAAQSGCFNRAVAARRGNTP